MKLPIKYAWSFQICVYGRIKVLMYVKEFVCNWGRCLQVEYAHTLNIVASVQKSLLTMSCLFPSVAAGKPTIILLFRNFFSFQNGNMFFFPFIS